MVYFLVPLSFSGTIEIQKYSFSEILTFRNTEEKLNSMVVKMEENLINVDVLIKRLKEKGIEISRSGIYYWILKGVIPSEYIVPRKRGARRKIYYFKPEVIDYLLEKLGKG